MRRQVYRLLKLTHSIILAVLIFTLSGLPGLTCAALALNNSDFLATSLPPAQTSLNNPQELEVFVDHFFAEQMPRLHIPGAVFTLVKDGKIYFSKGYGYANLKRHTPVDPDRTLFRLGSVSKLLTATAVMQLAEKGKFNLNDDINPYLKQFKLKKKHQQSVTFANLLTHTDGFDVAWTIGSATRCQSKMQSLEKFLAKNLPSQVFPPGEVYLYGDVGMALAGYLVEVISGVPFRQYIDQNILQPLDMVHSSFLQPLPPDLAADLAVGYINKNGASLKRPFTCFKSLPTAAFSATATDIAHFMIAHLQRGRYGTKRILKASTAEEMHRQHFINFPDTPQAAGTAYGFYERYHSNHRMIEHGGSMAGYTSLISLMPAQNLGFFVAYNDNKLNENLGEDLYQQFLDRYYPASQELTPVPIPSADIQQHSRQINGSYRYIRYPRYSLVKLATFLLESKRLFHLKANDNGTLMLWPQGSQWVEVEPLLYQHPDSNIYMNFQQDTQDQITGMAFSSHVFATFEKLAWYENPGFQLGWIGFCVLVFCSGLLIWPINPLLHHFQLRKQSLRGSRVTRLARFLVGLISALNIVFLIGMLLVVFQINFWEFAFGMPPIMIALLYLPILTTGIITGLPFVVFLAWKDNHWSVIGRFHCLLTMLAAVVFIPFLTYWNLLGFQF